MNLLAPLFLAGIALVVGPILFHLIRRQPKDRVSFSSTEFLEESPPRIKRRNRIQNPWLLLIRCLVILLLCFAFARPFFAPGENPPAIGSTPRDMVVALDRSASMSREGIAEAVEAELTSIADSLNSYDRFVLIGFSDTARTLVSETQWAEWSPDERVSQLVSVLADSPPRPATGKIDLAVNAAIDALETLRESSNAQAFGEIVVLSDFAEGSQYTGLAGAEWPLYSSIRRIVVSPESGDSNVGIRWLGWSEDGPQRQARIALIHSNPTIPVEVVVKVENALTGDSITDDTTHFLENRPEQVVAISLPAESEGLPLRIQISGDGAAFDNELFVAPEFTPSLSVAFASRDEISDTKGAAYFIEKAMNGIEKPRLELITDLQAADALIVDRELDTSEATSVRSQIEAGAQALLILHSEEQLDTFAFLSRTETSQLAPSSNSGQLIGSVDFSHPLFRPFADPRFSNFASIRIWNAPALRLPEKAEGFREIAALDSGDPLLLEKTIGAGKLYVWISSWRPADSQWLLSSKFVPWMASFFREASGGPQPPSNALFSASSIRAYSDFEFERAPDRPGLYRVDNESHQRWFAFQLPPAESETKPLSDEAWDLLGLPEYSEASREARKERLAAELRQENAVQAEKRQQLWKWLLIATLSLLAIESLLAIGISQRREAQAA